MRQRSPPFRSDHAINTALRRRNRLSSSGCLLAGYRSRRRSPENKIKTKHLMMSTLEQQRADENVLKLVEEQMGFKELAVGRTNTGIKLIPVFVPKHLQMLAEKEYQERMQKLLLLSFVQNGKKKSEIQTGTLFRVVMVDGKETHLQHIIDISVLKVLSEEDEKLRDSRVKRGAWQEPRNICIGNKCTD